MSRNLPLRLPDDGERRMTTAVSRSRTGRGWTDPILDSWVIAVIDDCGEVEALIEEFVRCGVDMRMVSVVGPVPAPREGSAGFYTLGERIRTWGSIGALWGTLWRVLIGAAVFWVPGLGQIGAAGPFVESLADDVEGETDDPAASGRVLARLLSGIGVTEGGIAGFEAALRSGQYLIITRGPPQEMEAVKCILVHSAAAAVHVLSVTDAARKRQ
jgi:hypothetical protein